MNRKYVQGCAVLCAILVFCVLPGCGKTAASNANMNEVQTPGEIIENVTPAEASESADKAVGSSRPTNVSSEPSAAQTVDLSGLEDVTEAYVNPLIWCGPLWWYTWETPAQIKSDDLLAVFGYNNFLDLPKDFEGCYSPEDSQQPAAKVEPILEKYFGVSGDDLKTSQYYDADTDTYQIQGGFGGGANAVATSVQQQGDMMVIHVGILSPVSDEEKTPDMVFASDGRALLPGGTLTLRPGDGEFPSYLSYIRDEG